MRVGEIFDGKKYTKDQRIRETNSMRCFGELDQNFLAILLELIRLMQICLC